MAQTGDGSMSPQGRSSQGKSSQGKSTDAGASGATSSGALSRRVPERSMTFVDLASVPDDGYGPEVTPENNAFFGKEVEILPTNFKISTDDRLKAAGGIPPWARRARNLEDKIERLWREAAEEYSRLKESYRNKAEFSRRWLNAVSLMPLDEIAGMVKDYNEYYPIEANLGIDPATGRFRHGVGLFELRTAPTREDVLARFPAS